MRARFAASERGDRRRRARPAPRAHGRASVRDAGARVLHLGGSAPRSRGARARRRGRARERPPLRAQQPRAPLGGRDAQRAARPARAARGARRSLYAEAYRRRQGCPRGLRPARGRGAHPRRRRRAGGGRVVGDRRAVPRRVARPGVERQAAGGGADAGLDRRHELAARRVLPAARRAARASAAHEVTITAREFAQTLELLDDAGPRAHGRRPAPRRRRRAREDPRDGVAPDARCGASRAPGLRPRPLARLARAAARGAVARRPVVVRVRLRVRARPAPARLPRGDARRRPGGDPAGAPRRGSARATRKVRRYPGLKEEYYLARLRARTPSVLDALGLDPLARPRRRPDAARGVALPPARRHAALRGRARAARPATPACRPSSCRARRRSARRSRAARAVARRARPRGRRAEPRRARRSRRLRGRHDEPRGGRARHARLHDVRGAARRGRRAARRARDACGASTGAGDLALERRGTRPPQRDRPRRRDASCRSTRCRSAALGRPRRAGRRTPARPRRGSGRCSARARRE